MNLNKVILILATDDETLGCGGTLLRHKADKCELLANWNINQKSSGYTTNQITEREKLIKKVLNYIVLKQLNF